MNIFLKKSAFTLGLLAITALVRAEPGIVSVQVQVAPGKNWTNYPTRFYRIRSP